MSIRWMKTFIAVAQHGSFAAAAQQIGLTQAAVSIQMSALEAELRVGLFDRGARAAVLNTAGRALVPRARELVHLYENLADVTGDSRLGGVLALGAIPPTFAGLLPDALLLLRQAHPGVAVRVSTGVSSDLMRRVEHGELDAAIVGRPPFKLAHSMSWQAVATEPLMLLAPAASKAESLAAMLAAHPFIGVSSTSWTGQMVHALLRRHRLKVNQAMELDSLETIAAMVARGFGISIMPLSPSRWSLDERIRIALLTRPRVAREIGVIRRRSHDRDAQISALCDSLLAVPAERIGRVGRIAVGK